MIESFDRGDLVRLGNATGTNADGTARAPFANIAGVATDPTTVTLKVIKPDATQLVYAWPTPGVGEVLLTKEAATTGRFYHDLTITDDGDWHWELKGTGAVETSETGTFHCRWSPFA